jgi:hypothetical protein
VGKADLVCSYAQYSQFLSIKRLSWLKDQEVAPSKTTFDAKTTSSSALELKLNRHFSALQEQSTIYKTNISSTMATDVAFDTSMVRLIVQLPKLYPNPSQGSFTVELYNTHAPKVSRRIPEHSAPSLHFIKIVFDNRLAKTS